MTSKLRNLMAGYCLEDGLKDFDVSITLGLNRRLTQRISAIVYGSMPACAGIRYPSRHSADVENWALFEPLSISDVSVTCIRESDPDLLRALEILNLRML